MVQVQVQVQVPAVESWLSTWMGMRRRKTIDSPDGCERTKNLILCCCNALPRRLLCNERCLVKHPIGRFSFGLHQWLFQDPQLVLPAHRQHRIHACLRQGVITSEAPAVASYFVVEHLAFSGSTALVDGHLDNSALASCQLQRAAPAEHHVHSAGRERSTGVQPTPEPRCSNNPRPRQSFDIG